MTIPPLAAACFAADASSEKGYCVLRGAHLCPPFAWSRESLTLLVAVAIAQARKSRRHPRIALPRGMMVAWQSAGDRVVSRVGTLGLGGLFIHTPKPPPVGEIIKLFFEVPGGEVRARAVVRDSQPGKGMGLEFTSMGHEDRARLNLLLRKLLSI